MAEVALQIGTARYHGWQAVSISRGIAQVAGTFDLSLTDKWTLDKRPRDLAPGQRVQVLIDAYPVITGWIDDVEVTHSADEHTLSVRGRDATGDLVDCAALHKTQEWAGRNLLQVARDLLKPFKIAVRAEVSVGAPYKYNHAQPGETVYELLARAARYRGVLLISDGNGGLIITRAGQSRASRRLELGRNIKRGRATASHRDRYSLYHVLAQDRGDDFLADDTAAGVSAEVSDPAVKRYRPTVIKATDPIDYDGALTRARWERSLHSAIGNDASITVRGWLDGAAPWQPNKIVEVRDPWLGLNGDYLIAGVDYSLDSDGGEITELTLAPPGAFDVLAETETDPAGDSALFAEGAA